MAISDTPENAKAQTTISSSQPTTSKVQVAKVEPKSANSDTLVLREVRKVAIPYGTHMKMSHDVTPGNSVVNQHGKAGVKERSYDVVYKHGNPVAYKMVAERIVQPAVDQVILAGIRTRDARALPSRSGSYDRIRELNLVATGYSPYEGSGAGLTANGMHAGYGVVAVDPRLIPLGSRLYIDGYGYAIAGDTGGAIKGHRIDLGHTTYREAANVGRHSVHVYVLSSPH